MMTTNGKRFVGKEIGTGARRQGNLGKLDSMCWSEFRRLAPLEQERLLIGARLEKILPNTFDLPGVGWWDPNRFHSKVWAGLDPKVSEVNADSSDPELQEKVFLEERVKQERMRKIDEEIVALTGKIAPQEEAIPPGKFLQVLCRISVLVEEKSILEEQAWLLGNAWRNLNGQNRHITPGGY